MAKHRNPDIVSRESGELATRELGPPPFHLAHFIRFACLCLAFSVVPISGCGGAGDGGSQLGDQQTAIAILSWSKPSINEDGSILSDLMGYQIYYGQTSQLTTENSQSTFVSDPDQTSYALSGLSPGTYYFAVTAFNSDGSESGMSNEVSKTIL